MDDTERLQQRVEPILRLTGVKAIQQAHILRMSGLTYRGLAVVMGIYHGEWYTPERWRDECRKLGAPVRPGAYRGRPRVRR